MAFLHDDVLDNGLSELTSATSTALHLCHTMPASRAEALSFSVGNKAGPSISAPAARSPSGRRVSIAAFTDGVITATSSDADDDAQFWALIDGTRLLAAGDITEPQMVTTGNPWSLQAPIDIGIPGPA